MPGHFNHDVVEALKHAVVKVFWTRTQMRSMLNIAGVAQSLITAQDWTQYKYLIVSPVIDELNISDDGLGPLRRMLQETLRYENCRHLLRFSDGASLKSDAEAAVEHLRSLVTEHDSAKATEEEETEARKRRVEEAQKGRFFQQKLTELHAKFMALFTKDNEQERGFDLESLLNEVFTLFELSPQSPFRRVGEQIDGAFAHNRDNYLLEAKWQKPPCNLADLRDLDGAVNSSLDNTLGLFVSVSGFSSQALEGYIAGSRPRIICMDGSDLLFVLEGRIDLLELLIRKKEIAAQRRRIFASAQDILLGRS